jgi:hypothetical protein
VAAPPYTTRRYGVIECTYWNEVGVLYSRGRVVHVAANASGRVTAISVSNIRKLIGVSFGASA